MTLMINAHSGCGVSLSADIQNPPGRSCINNSRELALAGGWTKLSFNPYNSSIMSPLRAGWESRNCSARRREGSSDTWTSGDDLYGSLPALVILWFYNFLFAEQCLNYKNTLNLHSEWIILTNWLLQWSVGLFKETLFSGVWNLRKWLCKITY